MRHVELLDIADYVSNRCSRNHCPRERSVRLRQLCVGPSRRVGSILGMSSVEHHDEEGHLHLFAVDDPRLWEFRSRLSDQDFAIPDVRDEDWDSFHAIIAEA
jgi:hypothetical protein